MDVERSKGREQRVKVRRRQEIGRVGWDVGGGSNTLVETATSKEQGETEANTGEECEGGTREGRTGRGFGSDDPNPLACE